MSDLATTIRNELAKGEELISLMDNIELNIRYVPHIKPNDNEICPMGGAIALTNRRLIIILWDGKVWKWLYVAGLNWYSERFINKDKPTWPYQAILMLPSGMGLIVQTQKQDRELQKQLSSLLMEAFMRLGTSRESGGAMTAIIDYEEELQRSRSQSSTDTSKK